MIIPVKTSVGSYDIVLDRGALSRIGEYVALDRKVLIVTDNGVPSEYAKKVASFCENSVLLVLEQGEKTKNIQNFELILKTLLENNFTRTDCLIAVGGGVVGDIAGFASSAYMRGIDFYNVPTTLLSQVDSSIGGKTAIDFMGVKNIVGAFYPPKKVIIDPDTLKTLPKRQIANGLAEALKMSLTNDPELFNVFENSDIYSNLDLIIERSLRIKKSVVEADEKESGLRRVLNFGHTIGHAIEALYGDQYYHGECVALGMIPMCSDDVRTRLLTVLKKISLPTDVPKNDMARIISICEHDKKMDGRELTAVFVSAVGSFEFKKINFDEFEKTLRQVLG